MDDINNLFAQGYEAFKNKDYNTASKFFNQVLEIDENEHKTWNALGVVNSKLGNYDFAKYCFETAISICPEKELYQKNLKSLLEKLNDPSNKKTNTKNQSSFKERNEKPKSVKTGINSIFEAVKIIGGLSLVIFIFFIVYTGPGQELTEKAQGNNIDIISSDTAYDLANQADSLRTQGKNQDAVEIYKQALELEPDAHSVWNSLGNTYNELGNYQEAITAYDKSLSISPDNITWKNKGSTLYDLKIYEEANNAFDKSLSYNPDDSAAWYMKAQSLNKLERYDDALKSIDRALLLDLNDEDAWNIKGVILDNLKRYDEAMDAYDRAIVLGDTEFAPDNKRNLEEWLKS